jgi:hypothetical protein
MGQDFHSLSPACTCSYWTTILLRHLLEARRRIDNGRHDGNHRALISKKAIHDKHRHATTRHCPRHRLFWSDLYLRQLGQTPQGGIHDSRRTTGHRSLQHWPLRAYRPTDLVRARRDSPNNRDRALALPRSNVPQILNEASATAQRARLISDRQHLATLAHPCACPARRNVLCRDEIDISTHLNRTGASLVSLRFPIRERANLVLRHLSVDVRTSADCACLGFWGGSWLWAVFYVAVRRAVRVELGVADSTGQDGPRQQLAAVRSD